VQSLLKDHVAICSLITVRLSPQILEFFETWSWCYPSLVSGHILGFSIYHIERLSVNFLSCRLAFFHYYQVVSTPYLLMASRSGQIEMSAVEPNAPRSRPSTPKSAALDSAASKRNSNIERFERMKQEVQATPSAPRSSRGDLQRPKSINGHHLRLFGVETSGWNQSPTQGVFPPRKTKLHEYNRIWRRNHTLSFGTALIIYSSP
jgi:hypothetical protein